MTSPTAPLFSRVTPVTPVPARPTAVAGGLVHAAAPPFLLPGAHFSAGVLFLLLGAAGLVGVAPDIARGGFALPRVAAVTHLFTLGWITTSIMGALYQFLPVALQVPIRSPRLAYSTLLLYAPGLLLFVSGLLVGATTVMLAGAVLFGSGLLIFLGNLAVTLRRAPGRNLTWWCLAAAGFFLACTLALGISLAGNLHWGYLGANRFLAVGVHLHVAIAGWVMMVMIGVAHRLLPMFLLSHGASEIPGRVAAGLIVAGVTLLLAVHHTLTPALEALVGVVLAGGVATFLLQAALYFRHRKKPTLDPGLRIAASGLGPLVLAIGISPFFAAYGVASPRVATAYALALVGGPVLFVAGHYYKILPFLVWFHRFGPLVGRQPVPRVADLYPARPGNLAALLLAGGLAGLIASTLAGNPLAARAAALLFAGGVCILAAQMLLISRRRP